MCFYGTLGGRNSEAMPAQVHIFSPDQDPRKSSKAPLFSINLQSSQVCVLRLKPSSPRRGRPSTGMLLSTQSMSCSFCITTDQGMYYEFRASDEAECQLWVSTLKFMIVFPFSSVPQEPQYNPAIFNTSPDPRIYGAGQYLALALGTM